jgi:hypothetical protein
MAFEEHETRMGFAHLNSARRLIGDTLAVAATWKNANV